MKKILLILLIGLLAVQVYAAPNFGARSLRQQDLARKLELPSRAVLSLDKEDSFGNTPVFRAAQQGDLAALAELERFAPNGNYLLRVGNGQNNVFHVARNLETFRALIGSFKHFFPADYKMYIHNLLEQKNDSLETPLRAQLNYGRADVYLAFFKTTGLYERIMSTKTALKQGGLMAEVVGANNREAIIKDSKDLSGLTPAQTARRNRHNPQMEQVLRFFEANAPYLVNPI